MSRNLKKKKPQTPRYPRWEWQGKFEAMLLRVYGRKKWLKTAGHLESFFQNYPGYGGLEQFTSSDVVSHVKWRQENRYSLLALVYELQAVRNLFRWLIEDCGLPLVNPVRPGYLTSIKRGNAFRPDAQPVRHALADIEIPASHVWPPVLDNDDLYDVIAGVY